MDDDADTPASEDGRGTASGGNVGGDRTFASVAADHEERATGVAGDGEESGLFEDMLDGKAIFEHKEVMRPSYTPESLPHRTEQINDVASILVSALRGNTPSNILIYGKTGTGKTACANYVSQELQETSQTYDVPCIVQYINCEVTDTQYRVLARLANEFIERNETHVEDRLADLESTLAAVEDGERSIADTCFDDRASIEAERERFREDREAIQSSVPMTGWPTDRVYNAFFDAVDYRERVVVIMLDEIDKLVEKSGDDTLYNLSRMNADLENSRVSIMGISNDLQFTDFLDPRVKSSLGEEEIVFPPYDAGHLQDILEERAAVAFADGAVDDGVIQLCAAFAAQEHGDARRALDLLRTAGELAERSAVDVVTEEHVRQAQQKIELDRVVEAVRTLPTQSKLVLLAIIHLDAVDGVGGGQRTIDGTRADGEGGEDGDSITTGEVYNAYDHFCDVVGVDTLTQRRVTDLIGELDMLGIVTAVVVSKGRYGRTKEIGLSVPPEETTSVLLADSRLEPLEDEFAAIERQAD